MLWAQRKHMRIQLLPRLGSSAAGWIEWRYYDDERDGIRARICTKAHIVQAKMRVLIFQNVSRLTTVSNYLALQRACALWSE